MIQISTEDYKDFREYNQKVRNLMIEQNINTYDNKIYLFRDEPVYLHLLEDGDLTIIWAIPILESNLEEEVVFASYIIFDDYGSTKECKERAMSMSRLDELVDVKDCEDWILDVLWDEKSKYFTVKRDSFRGYGDEYEEIELNYYRGAFINYGEKVMEPILYNNENFFIPYCGKNLSGHYNGIMPRSEVYFYKLKVANKDFIRKVKDIMGGRK